MKALSYDGAGGVRLIDAPEPVAAPGEVLIDVSQAGICGTDLGAVRTGRPAIAKGTILGHEFAGRRRDTGTRVTVNPIVGCGICEKCRAGNTNLCSDRLVIGVHRHGAFAPRVAVPAVNIVDIGNLSDRQAAMIEPIATALHAVLLAGSIARVAVLGAGAIGLSALFVLRMLGAQDVTVSDIIPEKLAHAATAGANTMIGRLSGTYEATIDCVGASETRTDAVECLRPGGTAVLVGLHAAELSLRAGPLIAGEKTIRGSFAYSTNEFARAVQMANQFDEPWVWETPFDRSEAAFSELLTGRGDPRHAKIQFRPS